MYIQLHNGVQFIKQNDTGSQVQFQILGFDKLPYDLTDKNVEVVIGNELGRLLVKSATVLDALEGIIEWGLDEGDVLPSGTLELEVHIQEFDGDLIVAPSKKYYKLRVEQAIDELDVVVTTYTFQYFLDQAVATIEQVGDMEQATAQAVAAALNAQVQAGRAEIAAETLENTEMLGAYNTETAYKKNNVVTFNGSSYMAKVNTQNNPPPSDPLVLENAQWSQVGRKGMDGGGTVAPLRDEFTATAGQTVFTTSQPYDMFQNRLSVYVDGVFQPSTAYSETSSTSITFNEGIEAGLKVVIQYFAQVPSLASDLQTTVNNHTTVIGQHSTQIAETAVQLAEIAINVSSFKTTNNSWTDAFEACVNYCISKSIKKVKLPPGELTIDRDLSFSGSLGVWDLIFEGDGKGIDGRGTSLKIMNTASNIAFDLSQPVAGAWRGITFRDLVIRGSGKGINNGLKLISCQQALFENCGFEQFNKGVILTGGSHYALFRNCYFTLCTDAIIAPTDTDIDFAAGSANNGKLENCIFRDCDHPANIGDGGGWKMDNCDLEGENGDVILSSYNVLDNVRIERNKHLSKWLHVTGVNNRMFINCHADGGHQPTPLMQIDGNFNEIHPTGRTLEIVDSSSQGINNTLHFSDYRLLLNRPLIQKWKRPNFLSFTIPSGTDLITQKDLKLWTKSSPTAIGVSDTNLSNGKTGHQLVKNEATEASITFTISKSFKSGETFYLTLEKENLAGGGWEVKIGDFVYDINSYFDDLNNSITILGYVMSSDVASLSITIRNSFGGVGSAMNIGRVIGSNILSGDFNI